MEQYNVREMIYTVDKFFDKLLSFGFIRYILNPFFTVYVTFVIRPLYKRFYRSGPWWLGGLQNRPSHDICNQFTGYGYDNNFWNKKENVDNCEDLIFERFYSYVSVLETLVYFGLLVYVFNFIMLGIRRSTWRFYENTRENFMIRTRREIEIIRNTPARRTTPNTKRNMSSITPNRSTRRRNNASGDKRTPEKHIAPKLHKSNKETPPKIITN